MTVKAEKRPGIFQAHSASSKLHDDFLTLVLPKKTALTSLFHSSRIFSLILGFFCCFFMDETFLLTQSPVKFQLHLIVILILK